MHVCVGRLSVDSCIQPPIFCRGNQHVQKGHGSISFGVLTGELNVRVYGNYVLQEFLFWGFLDD